MSESFESITSKPPIAWISVACGLYAILGAAGAIIGWLADIPRLTDWEDTGISMFVNTAVCAMLSGAGLVMSALRPTVRRGGVLILAGVVLLIAASTLVEHLSGTNLGIDTLLVNRPWGQTASAAPMRMGPPASTSFTLIALALLLLSVSGKQAPRTTASVLGVIVIAIAMLSLVGYLYGAERLYTVPRLTGIAMQTATMIVAIGVGLIAAIPERGLAALLTMPDAGGVLARRALLPVILFPITVGALRVAGQDIGLYGTHFGTAIHTMAMLVCFFGMLIWAARGLSRTSRALADRALLMDLTAKGRAMLAAIVDSSDDAIIAKNLDGTITSWNAGAERLFGYTAKEVIGQSISIVFPPDRLDEEPAILERLKRGERVEHFETIRVRKDGARLDISLTISPVKDSTGRIIGASKIARDITERKRVEEALRRNYETFFNLVDQSPFGVYVIDSQFRIHQVNAGAQPAFRNVRPLIGRDFAEAIHILWPEPFATQVVEIFKHTLETGEPYFAPSLTEKRADVDVVESYEWQIHRISLPDGQYAVVCNFYDSTKLRKAEQELARAGHLKDEFLATLSHELRTPMAAIQGWAHMLRGSATPEETRRGIEVIERNARLQSQIIEDLLDMSRIISGKVRLDVQSVQMGEIVGAAVDAIRPAAAARGVRLKSICDPRVSEVRGDPNRLQQVVYNLLTNAVKFTPRDGQVQVACQRVNSHVEVSVSDTGMGIKQEFLPHVFERFRQQDASTTRQHQGLGLGLAIVKQIVELHGGSVQAASEGEGKGATFTVHLPVSIVITPSLPDSWDKSHGRVHPITERTMSHESGQIDDHALGDLKVLVVDDEPDARDLIRAMLNRHGAEVLVAGSAADALDRLAAHRPNIVICDIGMPEVDGYELIRAVRSLPPERGGDTPALALTAFARSEDRTRSLRAGFQMHLSKPVEPQELVASIVTLAGRSR